MKEISRRGLLAAIAATGASATVLCSEAEDGTSPNTFREREINNHCWYIARQQASHAPVPPAPIQQHAVDFWSKPLCTVAHAEYLPPEISRSVLWYRPTPDRNLHELLEYIDAIAREYRFAGVRGPRTFAVHFEGLDTLSSLLKSVVPDQRLTAASRMAFLDLDSKSTAPGEPNWDQIIPALADCYERIIGHYHLEQRGLRHHYALLDPLYPEQKKCIRNTISQCDAVIFTSPNLVETDINLSAYASTEALVGQLLQRFGHALLDTNILEQIAPIGNGEIERKSRTFALGSVTSTALAPEVDLRALARQRELVTGSFGERPYERPLLIATLTDDASAEVIRNQLRGTNFLFLKATNSNRLCGGDPLEPLELLTLWPFDAASDRRVGMG
jgi:hypothetical protein